MRHKIIYTYEERESEEERERVRSLEREAYGRREGTRRRGFGK